MIKKICACLFLGLFFILTGLVCSAKTAHAIRLNIGLTNNINELSQEQIQFAANNFDFIVLSQGPTDHEIASDLKSYNSEVWILGYINSRQLVLDSWRYKECEDNENIFAHSIDNVRILSVDFNQYLTDINNSDWTEKIIEWANKLPSSINGIFLDDAKPTLHEQRYVSMPAGYDPYQYTIAMENLFYNIKQNYSGKMAFNGIKEGIWNETYTELFNGGLLEGFVFFVEHQDINPGRIKNDVNAIIESGRKGIIVSALTKSYKENIQSRIFSLACYLLGANRFSTYSFLDLNSESNPLQYYPEYDIDLGSPVENPDNVEDLIDPETYLVIRHFDEGMVIVNPWSDDIDIQLSGEYSKIIPNGGGVVRSDGTYDGYLDYESVPEFVTVPRGTAMILIDNDVVK